MTRTEETPAARSVPRAIGRSVSDGHYHILFYYQLVVDGELTTRDPRMPTWEIPARDWEHMQATVAAFNGDDI